MLTVGILDLQSSKFDFVGNVFTTDLAKLFLACK